MFDGSLLDHLIFIPAVYAGFSFGEWFIHRHAMHEPIYEFFAPFLTLASDTVIAAFQQMSGRHVTHHQLTNNDDMTIINYKRPNKNKKDKSGPKVMDLYIDYRGENTMEKFNNLFFLWPTTFGISILLYGGIFTANLFIFKCSMLYCFILATVFLVYQSAVWNCMHPMLHEYKYRLRWYEGIDIISREWFRETGWYKFLWKNHVLHHIVPGKDSCNFNVALPFADWLLGTYRSHYKRYKLDCDAFTVTKI